jgi:hypothetical protein
MEGKWSPACDAENLLISIWAPCGHMTHPVPQTAEKGHLIHELSPLAAALFTVPLFT